MICALASNPEHPDGAELFQTLSLSSYMTLSMRAKHAIYSPTTFLKPVTLSQSHYSLIGGLGAACQDGSLHLHHNRTQTEGGTVFIHPVHFQTLVDSRLRQLEVIW